MHHAVLAGDRPGHDRAPRCPPCGRPTRGATSTWCVHDPLDDRSLWAWLADARRGRAPLPLRHPLGLARDVPRPRYVGRGTVGGSLRRPGRRRALRRRRDRRRHRSRWPRSSTPGLACSALPGLGAAARRRQRLEVADRTPASTPTRWTRRGCARERPPGPARPAGRRAAHHRRQHRRQPAIAVIGPARFPVARALRGRARGPHPRAGPRAAPPRSPGRRCSPPRAATRGWAPSTSPSTPSPAARGPCRRRRTARAVDARAPRLPRPDAARWPAASAPGPGFDVVHDNSLHHLPVAMAGTLDARS